MNEPIQSEPTQAGATPWTTQPTMVIPGNYASVSPLPPGTEVGNFREMAAGFEPLQQCLERLSKKPDDLHAAVSNLTAEWKPGDLDDRITKELREEKAAHEAPAAAGRSGDSPASSNNAASTTDSQPSTVEPADGGEVQRPNSFEIRMADLRAAALRLFGRHTAADS